MKDELKEIFPQDDPNPGRNKILDYINGNLSGAELRDFEKLLASDPFLREATEGLRNMNRESIDSIQAELDIFIRKQVKGRKERKRKKIEMKWIYTAVIMILLLAIVAFIVIKKMSE